MSKPITVMHLRATNFVGGPEKQILEHFTRLNTTKFKPILGTFVEKGALDPLGDEAIKRGLAVVRLPARSPLNPNSIINLFSALRNYNVDILCTHGYKPNILGFLAAKLGGIPTVAISRGWTWESPKIRFYEALDRRFLRYVNYVVAVSAGQQEKIVASGVPHTKVSVIHNAINLNLYKTSQQINIRHELGLPNNAIIVASAGRLSPEKNYASMIEVANDIVKHDPLVYFVIFGEGGLRVELETRIDSLGLKNRFLLPGFRIDLQSVLHEIDIFMLPSFTEGLPNVILEAFAVQKPVVATRVGGTPEVVQDGVSGFLTRPEEHALMTQHLHVLVKDVALRQKMGEAGFKYVREEFGFEKQTELYEHLYQNIAV